MPDSIGYRNHKVFAADGPSNDADDLTYLSGRIADLGTRRVGTTDDRNALPSEEKWDGLQWGDTTNGNEYRFRNGAFDLLGPYPRDTKTGSVGQSIGIGPNETKTIASTSVTIPNGRAAVLRISVVASMAKNATDGAFAGSLGVSVAGATVLGGVPFHTQNAGLGIAFYPGLSWNVPIVGTGQPVAILAQVSAQSRSAAGVIYSGTLLVSAEY